jgi:hypothetical protein
VLFCSISSLTCYVLLLIPTSIIRTPLFAVVCFAFGYGPAPLLLVIMAPFLTEHISTALGLHKALEMVGSTLMQTVPSITVQLMNSLQGYYLILRRQHQYLQIHPRFVSCISFGSLSYSICCTSFPASSSFDWIKYQITGMWSMQSYKILKRDIKLWSGRQMMGMVVQCA